MQHIQVLVVLEDLWPVKNAGINELVIVPNKIGTIPSYDWRHDMSLDT